MSEPSPPPVGQQPVVSVPSSATRDRRTAEPLKSDVRLGARARAVPAAPEAEGLCAKAVRVWEPSPHPAHLGAGVRSKAPRPADSLCFPDGDTPRATS
jgi:hypothetical protein